jgi:hypothetical protein
MALSFGSHAGGRGGEKWVLPPFSRTLRISTSRGVCRSKHMDDEADHRLGCGVRNCEGFFAPGNRRGSRGLEGGGRSPCKPVSRFLGGSPARKISLPSANLSGNSPYSGPSANFYPAQPSNRSRESPSAGKNSLGIGSGNNWERREFMGVGHNFKLRYGRQSATCGHWTAPNHKR